MTVALYIVGYIFIGIVVSTLVMLGTKKTLYDFEIFDVDGAMTTLLLVFGWPVVFSALIAFYGTKLLLSAIVSLILGVRSKLVKIKKNRTIRQFNYPDELWDSYIVDSNSDWDKHKNEDFLLWLFSKKF